MLFAIQGEKPAKLVVFAYDIASPRRARSVRKVLDSIYHCKQYSVYEALLREGVWRGVLAELSDCCDFTADRLAVWWPLEGLRLVWQKGQLQVDARQGGPDRTSVTLPATIGNFMVCYDISDTDALDAVAAEVASRAAMVQRSVYWLRASPHELSALLAGCAPHLADSDRLWAYPLCGSHMLWQVGVAPSPILPISTHRWRSL